MAQPSDISAPDAAAAQRLAGHRRLDTRTASVIVAWADSSSFGVDAGDLVAELSISDRLRFDSLDGSRRESFLLGRSLLRVATTLLLGAQDAIAVSARCSVCGSPHGRPTIIAGNTTLAASVSHTPELTFVAVTTAGHVGIDAELRDGTSPHGLDLLRGSADDLRDWTRVEAVLKADGRGLTVDPSNVRIERTNNGLRGAIAGGSEWYHLSDPEFDPRYAVTVAVL